MGAGRGNGAYRLGCGGWRVEDGNWGLGHGPPLQVMAEGARMADRRESSRSSSSQGRLCPDQEETSVLGMSSGLTDRS